MRVLPADNGDGIKYDPSGKKIPTNTHGFYLVWNPQGHAPTKRHATRVEAEAEAERLSQKHPNESFYVLKTLSVDRTFVEYVTTREVTDFEHEEKTPCTIVS